MPVDRLRPHARLQHLQQSKQPVDLVEETSGQREDEGVPERGVDVGHETVEAEADVGQGGGSIRWWFEVGLSGGGRAVMVHFWKRE